MLYKSIRYSILFFFLMAFATTQIRAQESSPDQLTDITLQLKWKHQFQFAGYYAAIEQGFYKDVGLNVHLLEAQKNADASETVLNGQAQFGVSTSDIVRLRSQGKDLVLLASIFQHSPQILVALKSSGIDHVQSLQHKKISMEHNAADITAFMNDEGVSLDEVVLYPHSFGIEQLLSSEVDALSAYKSDEPFLLTESEKEYIIIDPAMGGIDFYGDVLFTTGELVKTNPELVLNFREATLKGWKYAMNHTDEIARLIYTTYSDRHSLEHLQFEADKMQRLIMPDVVEIGYSNPGRWQHILDIYKAQHLLDEATTLDGFFYTDYLKPDRVIPWQIVIIFSVILVMVISVTLFYYFTTQKLKAESKRRLAVQHELMESEKRLRELNASKDRFYSIIAHDLRNPFSAILGFTELIMRDVKKDPKNIRLETLEIIKETILHTSELLNNLLLWSRNQIGNIEYQPEVFQLKTAITKSLDIVKAQATHKQIAIDVIGDDCTIFADPNMIQTILRNLLTNAIKFTPKKGQVSITITSDDTNCIIAVKDTGVGISSENIPKLFAVDSKFVNYGTEAEHGTGLGLLLCKEFIEKHSGSIEVSSSPDKGSTFTISLPRFKNF